MKIMLLRFYLILLILEFPLLPAEQALLDGRGEGEAGAGAVEEVLQHPVHRRAIH